MPYRDAFLIGDLLTTRTTLLAGEPKAGKTLLAVGMVTALLRGEPEFLGLPVHRHLKHVVFGVVDDGAIEELRERFEGSGVLDRVTVFPFRDPGGDAAYWPGLRDDLVASGADLFVWDHILGGLGPEEDMSTTPTAGRVAANMRQIPEAGIPLLALTHTPKGVGDGNTVASSPIGGRAIAAGARGIIALRKSSDKGLRIQTTVNRASADLEIHVSVERASQESEAPIWSRRAGRENAGASRLRQKRTQRALDEAARAAAFVVGSNPSGATSLRRVAEQAIESLGLLSKPDGLRKKLGQMIEVDAQGVWRPKEHSG